MEDLLNKLLFKEGELEPEEISLLTNEVQRRNVQLEEERKRILLIEMILEYNAMKSKGKTNAEIQQYFKEDMHYINNSENYLQEHLEYRNRMFGYPANMAPYNSVEKYLRELEAKTYLINSCGGPNPETDRGYYMMDSKESEMNIISLFCHNMNIDPQKYWGYVTTGGTEGNFWGVRTGFELYPNGKLYYSADAHYSIPKSVKIGNSLDMLPNEEISSSKDGSINIDLLINKCYENWQKKHEPAIIVLTWGTTVYGTCDDISLIKNKLNELGIPNYIHLDAAMYGGIPNNQINSPSIPDLNKLNPDSISISLHKYIGNPVVSGVVICKKEVYEQKKNKQIEYIGQDDPTFLGSRDYPPFITEYRLKRMLERSEPNEYEENINLFMEEMTKNNIPFERRGNGNTFVIDLPNLEFAQKYQLATFDNSKKAHIIIFPYHDKNVILELIRDLKYLLNANKIKKLTNNN